MNWAPAQPLVDFLATYERKWKFAHNFRKREFTSDDYLANAGSSELSLITRLVQVPFSSFRRIEPYKDVMPIENLPLMLIDSLIVNKNEDTLEYHGLLRGVQSGW